MTMLNHLSFQPTDHQRAALSHLTSIVDIDSTHDCLILKGSAGTGKTSILKAATDYLHAKNICFELCAPTGRAAKVISSKSQRLASTMHSICYKVDDNGPEGKIKLLRKVNKNEDYTIYFVDESSMISDWHSKSSNFITPGPLLSDFISFVKSGNIKNKIVFVGDSFQLPPVVPDFDQSKLFSPALTKEYLSEKFNFSCIEVNMTQVMRQADGDPILTFATSVRNAISQGKIVNSRLPFQRNSTAGICHYMSNMDFARLDSMAVICRTNKNVNWWNKVIRERRGLNGKLAIGDHFIIQENSFVNQTLFTKGETGIITNITSAPENFAGLQFVDVELSTVSGSGEKSIFSTKILLDSLSTDSGMLHVQQEKNLFAEVNRTNQLFRESKRKSDDKYLSALRIRHSFAITCHKAQGGEWDHVLIDPWLAYKDMKWLYTAVTRARKSACSWA